MSFISFLSPTNNLEYNALFHPASEHSTGTTLPTIPEQLLVDIFISKEENVLKIEEVTDLYTKDHNN